MSSSTEALRAAIEHLFSTEYLFHDDHRVWRSMVADEDGNPRPVELSQLATFSQIARLTSLNQNIVKAEIAAAVKNSSVVELRRDEATNAFVVFRRQKLDAAVSDPRLRTVFAKPVHFDARDEDIVAFFSKWGTVESVERRQYLAGTVGSEKVRPSTFIVFSTVEEAHACVAARPSYGRCETDLGQLWVPQLTVVMRELHERAQSELLQRGAALAVQQAITGKGCDDDDAAFETNKFLRPRCTCKVWDIDPSSPTSSWQNIKAKLGSLTVSFPSLKKKIGTVHSHGNAAYVVCKSPDAAHALLHAYASVQNVNPNFAQELRESIPRLTLLDGEEEEAFIREYPTIVAAKVQKKVAANQKRSRE